MRVKPHLGPQVVEHVAASKLKAQTDPVSTVRVENLRRVVQYPASQTEPILAAIRRLGEEPADDCSHRHQPLHVPALKHTM